CWTARRGDPCCASGTNYQGSGARMREIHIRDELDMHLYFFFFFFSLRTWSPACYIICSTCIFPNTLCGTVELMLQRYQELAVYMATRDFIGLGPPFRLILDSLEVQRRPRQGEA